MILETRRLSKTYAGGNTALVDVDLCLGPGIFGLLGPNGAGKSTLMRTLATLQAPDSGDVRFDGRDFLADPLRARRSLGYLPQDVGVYPRVSAREMLDYLAGLKGLSGRALRTEVDAMLDEVNLGDAADQRLDTFSGGMRQRFGIAAAFVGKPALVIVDEPTAGLDPLERRRFQHLLARLARDCILLLSSHIVEDVAGLATRMALLNHGRVVLEGDPAELVAALDGQVFTRMIEADELAEWSGRGTVLSCRPAQSRLRLRMWATESPGEGFAAASPDLEDLYALHVGAPA